MRFWTRITGSFAEGFQDSQKPHSSSRRRLPMSLETLETRALLSNIPGVSLQYGNIAIHATQASGNVAVVSIDPANHNVKVSLNGQSQEFNRSQVYNITYTGSKSGHDSFTNNTNLVSLDFGYGGNNHITGGSSFNFVFFWGNTNTFTEPARSISDVFENGGKNDVIEDNGTVFVY
jgi:hypothetical protein